MVDVAVNIAIAFCIVMTLRHTKLVNWELWDWFWSTYFVWSAIMLIKWRYM